MSESFDVNKSFPSYNVPHILLKSFFLSNFVSDCFDVYYDAIV